MIEIVLCHAVLYFAAFSPQTPAAQTPGDEDLPRQLLTLKRVYVDRLTGGETAAQMRDLIISSLQGSKLFVLTENTDRRRRLLLLRPAIRVRHDCLQKSLRNCRKAGIGVATTLHQEAQEWRR